MYADPAMENHALKELLEKKALTPADRHEAAGWLIAEQNLPVSRACRLVKVSRTRWYRPSRPPDDRDAEVIGRL
jgi:putative transposase